MSKISHTIRFEEEDKEKIVELGQLQGRKFQAQVEYMLGEQLKNQRILLFLNNVQCDIQKMSEEKQESVMAKIANIVKSELE